MIGVDLVVLDGAGPASVGVTIDVIDAANRIADAEAERRARPIDLRVVTAQKDRTVRLRGGLSIDAVGIDGLRPRAWAVVAGLGAAGPTELDVRLAQPDVVNAASWLRDALDTGTRVAASCTGVFVAGAAGALDDRRCTTTWWLTGVLARRHPRAVVEPDELVVSDGPVITAGAQLAAADLTLEIVTQCCGGDLAEAVAALGWRSLAGTRRRPSGDRRSTATSTRRSLPPSPSSSPTSTVPFASQRSRPPRTRRSAPWRGASRRLSAHHPCGSCAPSVSRRHLGSCATAGRTSPRSPNASAQPTPPP